MEAWKEEGFCKRHRGDSLHDSAAAAKEKAIVDQVPLPLLTFVVDIACQALLHVQQEGAATPDAQGEETFIVCLFNDDVHDMVSVQNAVQEAVSCSSQEAAKIMMAAHNDGHCVALKGTEEACRACRDVLRQHGLGASVTTLHWLARELQACVIVRLLRDICAVSNGLRNRICEILLKGTANVAECGVVVAGGGERNSWQSTGPGSWISKLLRAEEDLWVGSLSPLHELYIQVIADEDSKNEFADLFVGLYPRMMLHMATADEVALVSAIDLSVQIFTVPTVVQRLVRQNNLLPVMVRPLVKFLSRARETGVLFDERERPNLSYKLFPRALHDLSYILRIPHVAAALVRKPMMAASSQHALGPAPGMMPDSWPADTDDLAMTDAGVEGEVDGRLVLSPESMLGKIVMEAVTQEGLKEYIEGIDEWLLLCEAMQGMNAHKRIAEGEHVQFEDQSWQLAFQLVRDFLDVQSLVLEGFRQTLVSPREHDSREESRAAGQAEAGKISSRPLCQYACRSFWRWCQRAITDDRIECNQSKDGVPRVTKNSGAASGLYACSSPLASIFSLSFPPPSSLSLVFFAPSFVAPCSR